MHSVIITRHLWQQIRFTSNLTFLNLVHRYVYPSIHYVLMTSISHDECPNHQMYDQRPPLIRKRTCLEKTQVSSVLCNIHYHRMATCINVCIIFQSILIKKENLSMHHYFKLVSVLLTHDYETTKPILSYYHLYWYDKCFQDSLLLDK